MKRNININYILKPYIIYINMYSQCGEDKFLNDNFFKNKKNGTFIELGALDGVLYSNTKFFEDSLNWHGILIEPNPNTFKLLSKNRSHNHNYLCNDLVSCYKEPLPYKYFLQQHSAVSGIESTLPPSHNDNYFNKYKFLPQNTINIIPKSLTTIIQSSYFKHFDLLSLDVEGHEYEILQSWDFSIPIDIILIEMLENEIKNELCRKLLIKNNYKFICVLSLNEIYILNSSIYDTT